VEAPAGNLVLRYLAVTKAARDFGLSQRDIDAVTGRFDPRRVRPAQLAEAFADLLLSRPGLRLPTA
jgi:hypothetical protein